MIEKFKEYLEEQLRSENTIKTYLIATRQYIKWYEDTFSSSFDKLLQANLAEYVSYLVNILKLDATTINLKLTALRQFNKYLVKGNYQDDMAVSEALFRKTQAKYLNPCKINQKDVDAFRQKILVDHKIRDYAIATLMSYAGLRISETISLQMDAVSLPAREIRVIGKGEKQRTVDIGEKVVQALQEYMKIRPEGCNYLFVSQKKGPLHRSTVNRIFQQYSDIITPHELRHFFCTHALEMGYDLTEVAYQAGHSDIRITQRYLHPDKMKMREKANRL